MKPRRGLWHRLRAIVHELSVLKQFRLASWPRLASDILASRALLLAPDRSGCRIRRVTMRDGTHLSYRLNRGDIQAIREIWLDEVYAVPDVARGLHQIVDLGANIGFTSVYLARQLSGASVVAVEPDPRNADVLRTNLTQNGIDAAVIEAAVGPADGSATFSRSAASNLGHVADDGELTVELVSPRTVYAELGERSEPKLLKLDIEGGEEQLFSGDLSWLDDVYCLLAELHPEVADEARIRAQLQAAGLEFRAEDTRGGPAGHWARSPMADSA